MTRETPADATWRTELNDRADDCGYSGIWDVTSALRAKREETSSRRGNAASESPGGTTGLALTRRRLLGAASIGAASGLAGCPSDSTTTGQQLSGQTDGQQQAGKQSGLAGTPASQQSGEATPETPSCPDDFDVPEVENPKLKGFVHGTGPIFALVGRELTFPQVQVEVSTLGWMSLFYELVGPGGDTLALKTEYYKVHEGTNYVPRGRRTDWVDYEGTLSEDIEVGSEVVRQLQHEGATLRVECSQCTSALGEPQTIETDVTFLGATRNIPSPKTMELDETAVDPPSDGRGFDLVTSWGGLWKEGVGDKVVLYANGVRAYEYDAISHLIGVGDSGYAFAGWTLKGPLPTPGRDPVEIVRKYPDEEKKWLAADPKLDPASGGDLYLSEADGEPVWLERDPVNAGLAPPAGLDTESEIAALVRAGKAIEWQGLEGDSYRREIHPFRELYSWTLNDTVLYKLYTERKTDEHGWLAREWVVFGDNSMWKLWEEKPDGSSTVGELNPFGVSEETSPVTISVSDDPIRVGTTGFALRYTLHNDETGEKKEAIVSPTADWKSPAYDVIGKARPTRDGVAFVGRDRRVDGGERMRLNWDDWQSDWAPDIRIERAEGLAKPVWTRTNEDGSEETFYGKEHLTDDFGGQVEPASDVLSDIAYTERTSIATLEDREYTAMRVCETGDRTTCGPWYSRIRDLVGTPLVAYVANTWWRAPWMSHVHEDVNYEATGIEHLSGKKPMFETKTIVTQSDGKAHERFLEHEETGVTIGRYKGSVLHSTPDYVAFWTQGPDGSFRTTTRMEAARLHLLDSTDHLQTREYAERNRFYVEGEFVGGLMKKQTGDESATYLVDTTDLTTPSPPPDRNLERRRKVVAARAHLLAIDARLGQLQSEIAVCNSIQKTIRNLGPIRGKEAEAALDLQGSRQVPDNIGEQAVVCTKKKLVAQIVAPLLANLGQLIVTAVDFASFVTGLSNGFREAINASASTYATKKWTETIADASVQISLKATNLVSKKLGVTEYSIPNPTDPDFRDAAMFWTKIARDHATDKQMAVIDRYVNAAAFKQARTDMQWEVDRMEELQTFVTEYNNAGTQNRKRAVALKMVRLHGRLEKRKEAVGRKMERLEDERKSYLTEMQGIRRQGN